MYVQESELVRIKLNIIVIMIGHAPNSALALIKQWYIIMAVLYMTYGYHVQLIDKCTLCIHTSIKHIILCHVNRTARVLQ